MGGVWPKAANLCACVLFLTLAVENLKFGQFMMADIIDPKYEYDAPVYVDFATVALDQVEDDEADKWFGKVKST